MAKKTTAATKAAPAAAPVDDALATMAPAVKTTKTRSTTVPPKAKKAPAPTATTTDITDEMIAERAYQLWKAGTPGGDVDHWTAAERELRGK